MKTRMAKPGYRYLSAFLGLLLVSQIVLYAVGNLWREDNSNASAAASEEDLRIAAELSNASGATAEDILRLKQAGIPWNEVMEQLRNRNGIDLQEAKSDRSHRLLFGGGNTEDEFQNWIDEGYSEDEVAEAKLLAERVHSQLQQLGQISEQAVSIPSALTEDRQDAKQEQYSSLLQQIQLAEAVTYMLELQDELGGYEAALNEYLLALQIGVDLSLFTEDRTRYEELKEQKIVELAGEEIVTIQSIEQDLLKRIQKSSQSGDDGVAVASAGSPLAESRERDTLLPDIPEPKAADVLPRNPADAVLLEIQAMDPKGDFQ